MLVIISLVRYEQARLPEQRVQLYNRAVSTLLDTWNYWRSMARIDIGGTRLPLDRLIRVWGAVAEWTRREKPTGVVHRTELKRKVIEVLMEREFDEDYPEATAESYLNAAADRAGLLEERGPDSFAFWHAIFEEFLAAIELATPTFKAIERLLLVRDDPRWREVILLAVGYVGIVQRDTDTATDIVAAVADRAPTALESLLHPHLRLAADCIADDVGVKRTLAQRIVTQLATVIQAQPYKPFTQVFVQIIRGLPRLQPTPETIAAITPLATHHERQVRMEVARLLSNVAGHNPEARALCEQLLEDEFGGVCHHAALGLVRDGCYHADVWKALLSNGMAIAYSKQALREFFSAAPNEAMVALKSCLNADEMDLRISAADLLCELGHVNENVVAVAESCLSADERWLRLQAAELFGKLGRVDEHVVEAVKGCLILLC
jgi:hypothetical protein